MKAFRNIFSACFFFVFFFYWFFAFFCWFLLLVGSTCRLLVHSWANAIEPKSVKRVRYTHSERASWHPVIALSVICWKFIEPLCHHCYYCHTGNDKGVRVVTIDACILEKKMKKCTEKVAGNRTQVESKHGSRKTLPFIYFLALNTSSICTKCTNFYVIARTPGGSRWPSRAFYYRRTQGILKIFGGAPRFKFTHVLKHIL